MFGCYDLDSNSWIMEKLIKKISLFDNNKDANLIKSGIKVE